MSDRIRRWQINLAAVSDRGAVLCQLQVVYQIREADGLVPRVYAHRGPDDSPCPVPFLNRGIEGISRHRVETPLTGIGGCSDHAELEIGIFADHVGWGGHTAGEGRSA